ncbi:MAG: HDOD domain-containing protein [Desulfobacteraceae bacterium]|nr:MAG: HDOD domain-containing protein [Desulfobacteraceae bacterium]
MSKVRAYILRMAGLSTTTLKVLRVCNEPDTSANTLNRVISLDPVLTGRVLQLVNSAYYSLPSKVSSLTRAIILLGINTVKNVVLSFALFESFSKQDAFRAFSADGFWAHSLSVAVAAKLLAAEQGVPASEREDYFVAGLMHDIGKIPLNHLFPDDYRQAAQWAHSSDAPMYEAEQAVIGIGHGEVGGVIAKRWELGPMLAEALSLHHEPPSPRHNGVRLVGVVALADVLTHTMGAGIPGGGGDGEAAGHRTLEAWGLSPETVAALAAAVAREIEKAQVFLEIAGRE